MEKLILIIAVIAFFVQSAFVTALCLRIKQMKKADEAYKTKESEIQVNQENKEAAEKILKGIENNEFKMHLQFIVDTKTKRIVSAEALSRW